jgi:putative transposase
MYKAYEFYIQPNLERQIALAKAFGCARWHWNYALNLCQNTYNAKEKGLSRYAIQRLLPALKKEYLWLTVDDGQSSPAPFNKLNILLNISVT